MSEGNDYPIVGVLAQEIAYKLDQIYPGQYTSYIASSYVKFIECAGAKVVPIWIGKDKNYYEDILKKVNGVLFPGGATWFYPPNGYADAGEHIFKAAVSMNDEGVYFPLWGTCLGYELLTYLSIDRKEHRKDCKSQQSLNLEFESDFRDSKLFGSAPEDVIQILSKQSVTTYVHQFCITKECLSENTLDKKWKVLSQNNDEKGFQFISSIESNKYPFYGVQFHPEKNLFERNCKMICHSSDAIKANRYFADFFIEECRKNNNSFANKDEELKYNIYNYPITYTALEGSSYEQCYLFK